MAFVPISRRRRRRALLMMTFSAGTSFGNGPPAAGRRLRDLVDHVHPLDHLAEHRVAVALRVRRAEVQELVVGDVDEELRGRGVGVAGARHRERARNVHEAGLARLLGFDRDRRLRRLLLEIRREAAALDHEARDHAVELRAVVVLGLHVVEEVRDGLRRGVGKELDLDLAGGRVELDLRIGGPCAENANAAASAAAAMRKRRRNIDGLLWVGKDCRNPARTSVWAGRRSRAGRAPARASPAPTCWSCRAWPPCRTRPPRDGRRCHPGSRAATDQSGAVRMAVSSATRALSYWPRCARITARLL